MAKSDAGRARIETQEERMDARTAQRIEDADVENKARPLIAEPTGEQPLLIPMQGDDEEHVPPEQLREPEGQDQGGDDEPEAEGGHGMDVDYLDELAAFALFSCLAVDDRSFRRERKAAYRRVLSEIYSPPRITKALSYLPNAKLVPGYALDLTVVDPSDGEPWDFFVASKRKRARHLLAQQKPMLVVGSPECKAFSTWNQFNRFRHSASVAERLEKERIAAVVHLDFVAEIARDQIAEGRYFLFEHPQGASSWGEPSIDRLS
jgi:hypothetical protein